MTKSLLVVAGSGRSGTSLFTGLAGRLGSHSPPPEVVALTSNPRGFGEPRWAVDFHNRLLRSVDVGPEDARPQAWPLAAKAGARDPAYADLRGWLAEQFALSDLVVVKDPRLGWFLELYSRVAADLTARLGVVTMVRHPAASIKSRELAYGTGSTAATRTAGWLNVMLFTELHTRELPRALVGYDELLGDWRTAMQTAADTLGLPLLDVDADRLAAADALVDPSLRRSAPAWSELGVRPDLQAVAERAYAALREIARAPGAAGEATDRHEALDSAREDYCDYYANAESVARASIAAARNAERRKADRRIHEAERAGRITPSRIARGVRTRLVRGSR
ncbi:MAG: sulfotransferase family protein [Nocardioidaceae bacterium]